jgi:hypothetical protein
MWRGPFIIHRVLEKGAYELVDYDGIPLSVFYCFLWFLYKKPRA